MTALDDLRQALSTVERWRDEATPLPWEWHDYMNSGRTLAHPNEGYHELNVLKTTDDWPARRADERLIVAAVSVLLDEGSGVAAILRDAIEHRDLAWRTEDDWLDQHEDALRLARLMNGIEATR